MAKRMQEYVKYTTKELDLYTQSEESCVRKINTNLHLTMGPFCLADFKHILMAHLVRSKVGYYDVHLDGIVLDIKQVKVLGTTAAMRADDPRLHVNINADVYVFKPEEGAEVTGVVKHIGLHHVGVILYRVFNANVRVTHKVDKDEVIMEQEVKFRIRKFNLQNVFPYIDGELLTPSVEKALAKGKKIKFSTENSDNGDSGIEKDGLQELDALLSIIKTEAPSEFEDSLEESRTKKSKKSKKFTKTLDNSAVLDTDTTAETTNNKSPKKNSRKRKSSTSAAISEEEHITPLTPKKIKKEELTLSDDSAATLVKKIKKEKTTPTKKQKSKSNSFSELVVSIKSEIDEDD